MFDFEDLQFINVTKETYQDYLRRYHVLEIVGNKTKSTGWIEIPIGGGHPKRVQEANHKISKSKNQAIANLSTEDGLALYTRTEALLDRLLGNDEY